MEKDDIEIKYSKLILSVISSDKDEIDPIDQTKVMKDVNSISKKIILFPTNKELGAGKDMRNIITTREPSLGHLGTNKISSFGFFLWCARLFIRCIMLLSIIFCIKFLWDEIQFMNKPHRF